MRVENLERKEESIFMVTTMSCPLKYTQIKAMFEPDHKKCSPKLRKKTRSLAIILAG